MNVLKTLYKAFSFSESSFELFSSLCSNVASFSSLFDSTGTSSLVNVADESSDTTCFPLFVTGASGNLAAKSGTNLTFNSATGKLTATSFEDGNGNALTTATAAADEATALGIALG